MPLLKTPQTLRQRIFRIVIITVGAMLLFGLIGLQILTRVGLQSHIHNMMDSFESIEMSAAETNLRRVQNAYLSEIQKLEELGIDWAKWDDTYLYAQDRNKAYEISNLIPDAFAEKGISHFLLFNLQDDLIASVHGYGRTKDNNNVPESVLAFFRRGNPVLHFDSINDIHSGLIDLPEGPLLFASRPIVKSSGEGPIVGTLIFTRMLDSVKIEQISTLTNLPLRLHRAKGDENLAYWPHWHKLDESTMFGELLVRDYHKVPRFRLEVQFRRDVYKRALETQAAIQNASSIFNWLMIACTILSAIVMIGLLRYLLSRYVVNRIQRLSEKADAIRKQGDLSLRIDDLGNDEIGHLAMRFNGMMESLEQLQFAMQQQYAERKVVMDAMPTGMVAIDTSFRISGSPSNAAFEFLGRDCIGMQWTQVLQLNSDQEAELLNFLDIFVQELLSVHDMIGLNPLPIIPLKLDRDRWIRITYYRLPHRNPPGMDEQVILALLEDITEQHAQTLELESVQSENLWLKAILMDPDLFLEFFRESEQSIAKVEHTLMGSTDRALIARAFRHIHTLQGCAAGFGLHDVSIAAVAVEHELSKLLKAVDGDDIVEKLESENAARDAITPLKNIVRSEQAKLHGALAQQNSDWKAGPSTRIPLHHLREWVALLDCGECAATKISIENSFHLPLNRLLHRTLLWFPGMVSRSGKKARLVLDGDGVKLPIDWSGILNDILVHLLRNCIAHGIESPQDRIFKGKPEEGVVHIHCESEGSGLGISVEDDGNGFSMDIQQAFLLGLSSRSESDGLAGRGVGLHAVKSMVEELGGKIVISSKEGVGAKIHLYFDLNPVIANLKV